MKSSPSSCSVRIDSRITQFFKWAWSESRDPLLHFGALSYVKLVKLGTSNLVFRLIVLSTIIRIRMIAINPENDVFRVT